MHKKKANVASPLAGCRASSASSSLKSFEKRHIVREGGVDVEKCVFTCDCQAEFECAQKYATVFMYLGAKRTLEGARNFAKPISLKVYNKNLNYVNIWI